MRTEMDAAEDMFKVSGSSGISGKAVRKVVFVVGAPRSGTSIVWLALRNALNSSRYGESHMMPFFASQAKRIRQDFCGLSGRKFAGTLAAETAPITLEAHFLNMVRSFYNEAYHGANIVDKTANLHAVKAIPFTRRVFPSAVFIFCRRRAIENVASRLRKWPNQSFESHCQWWTNVMSEWRSLRINLPEKTYREVDQHVIATRPAEAAQSLAEVMQLDWEENNLVLNTFRTAEASMIEGSKKERVLDLDCIDWDADRKRVFLEICGEELAAWGYTLDGTYCREKGRS
ncbi:MAG: sulfotransferase [Gammaproteobacteria bacterium]